LQHRGSGLFAQYFVSSIEIMFSVPARMVVVRVSPGDVLASGNPEQGSGPNHVNASPSSTMNISTTTRHIAAVWKPNNYISAFFETLIILHFAPKTTITALLAALLASHQGEGARRGEVSKATMRRVDII
jgi:hypothetical protein